MPITINQLVIGAARGGDFHLLQERVQAGGDVNYVDPRHGSAIACAIRNCDLPVLDWLIAHGVDVNQEQSPSVGPLEFALHLHADPVIVYRLVCAGAKLKRKTRPYYKERLEQCIKQVTSKNP